MRNKTLIYVLLCLAFFNCRNEEYELLDYLKTKHSLTNIDNGLYILMPTNTCSSCFETIKSQLLNLELSPKTHIIFISNNNLTIKGHAKDLSKKSNVLYDLNNDAIKEITGKNTPVIIVVKNGEIIEKIEVIPQNLENAKRTIREYN